jgi:hypothetical protein
LTIFIYVRNIFGLAIKESSHPSMMATSRATTSAVPPTADIVGKRGHVRKPAQHQTYASKFPDIEQLQASKGNSGIAPLVTTGPTFPFRAAGGRYENV